MDMGYIGGLGCASRCISLNIVLVNRQFTYFYGIINYIRSIILDLLLKVMQSN